MTKRKRGAGVKFCIVCGKKIPECSNRHKICSERCARKRKNLTRKGMAAPYEYATEPPITYYSLGEIQKRAMAAGLSYGQYMSRMYGSGGVNFEGVQKAN